MSNEVKWSSPSMEGKWKDKQGIVYLRSIEYYGKKWMDLRIMNMKNTPPNFTRHGVRLTESQLEEIIPVLRETLATMKDEREKDERNESGKHSTR
ncbi:MAG: hypothetical protein ACTSWQ_02070 [Candidatus Thorarchaeota archaeon]